MTAVTREDSEVIRCCATSLGGVQGAALTKSRLVARCLTGASTRRGMGTDTGLVHCCAECMKVARMAKGWDKNEIMCIESSQAHTVEKPLASFAQGECCEQRTSSPGG